MIPLILELDEELREGEQMTGVATIELSQPPHSLIGYVAVIKKRGIEFRYGSLRAYKHKEKGNVQ